MARRTLLIAFECVRDTWSLSNAASRQNDRGPTSAIEGDSEQAQRIEGIASVTLRDAATAQMKEGEKTEYTRR